jgi:hypothetical protein
MLIEKYKPEMYLISTYITYNYFYDYFKDHFIYGFSHPRVDIHSACKKLKYKIQGETNISLKLRAKNEIKIHTMRAKSFYSSMK